MPKAIGRSLSNVPPPGPRTSRKAKDKMYAFDGFIRMLDQNDVVEVELDAGDNLRSVKVSLRRAAARLGYGIDLWDSGRSVFIRRGSGASTRPRSMRDIARSSNGQPNLFTQAVDQLEEEDSEDEDEEEDDEEEAEKPTDLI